MKNNESFSSKRIYPLVFMLAVTVACILLTAGLYLGTKAKADANELSFARKAVLDAAGIGYTPTQAGIEQAYLANIKESQGYYETISGDTRYVIELEGPGLWGTITIMAGFESDLTTFSGLAIVSQNETPGLGARIEEPWFTAQFKGKQAPFVLVEEGTADSTDEVDSITGATRTSEYFRNLANGAAAEAVRIIGRR